MAGDAPGHLGYGIVAFTDILGFRGMVAEDATNQPPRFLQRILAALDELEAELAEHSVEVAQFSDSIVLSTAFSPHDFVVCLNATRRLQRLLVTRQISVRGGVGFGHHYAENGRLYSQALVAAYELESQLARFPRILVDPNLLDAALNHLEIKHEEVAQINEMVMRDRDGHTFIHYLTEELADAHRALIEAVVGSAAGSPSVLEKARWQADYHDFIASEGGCEPLDIGGFNSFAPLDWPRA